MGFGFTYWLMLLNILIILSCPFPLIPLNALQFLATAEARQRAGGGLAKTPNRSVGYERKYIFLTNKLLASVETLRGRVEIRQPRHRSLQHNIISCSRGICESSKHCYSS